MDVFNRSTIKCKLMEPRFNGLRFEVLHVPSRYPGIDGTRSGVYLFESPPGSVGYQESHRSDRLEDRVAASSRRVETTRGRVVRVKQAARYNR